MPTLIQKLHPQRVNQRLLRRAVEETIKTEGIRPRSVEVSIALVDDETIRSLNAKYRGKDMPTDVLSFAQEQALALPGATKLLGDVIISVDTAMAQAKAGQRNLDEELAHLVIHGVLHLLGYDDVSPEGYAEMVHKGQSIWQRIEHDASGAA